MYAGLHKPKGFALSETNEPDERPAHYLPEPYLLRYRDGGFVSTESKQFWKIAFCKGPKRISEYKNSPNRDYYAVQTTDAEKLWVYFDPEDKNFYLQGFL